MAEQLAQRDAVAAGHAGEVSGDRVVEAELALVLQQQHRRGGELLGDGRDLIGQPRVGGTAAFALLAIGLGQHDPPPAHDRDLGGGDARVGQRIADDLVDLRLFGRRQRLGQSGSGGEGEGGKESKLHRHGIAACGAWGEEVTRRGRHRDHARRHPRPRPARYPPLRDGPNRAGRHARRYRAHPPPNAPSRRLPRRPRR